MALDTSNRIGGELGMPDIPIDTVPSEDVNVTIDATAETVLGLTAGTATLQDVVDAIVATIDAL